MATEDKVLEETRRFIAVLPKLMESYAHRWVVFRDGQVVSAHESEQGAYESALQQFGISGGFVVAKVEPVAPTPVTAGVMFRSA